MTTGEKDRRWNKLGEWVESESRGLPVSELARRGKINDATLHRWLRRDLKRLPPFEVLQAIADGIGVPPIRVQNKALEVCGYRPPSNGMTEPQQLTLDAMAGMTNRAQRWACDLILRMRDETTDVALFDAEAATVSAEK